ncbi:MAG: hypothetical protein H7843_10820 [Nitrospirota bacterium]
MKYLLLVVVVLTMITGYAYADCSLPCGVEELITCAAQTNNMSAEDFYNKKLFMAANLDGFCKNPPAGSQDTQLQKDFFKSYCANAGSYYSYQNFINASKLFPDFGCAANTTKELRYKELANFFATVAQETTSALAKHTNDGLYWRYENGFLLGDNMTYHTPYYPEDNWVVATKNNTSPLLTYTGTLWYTSSGGAIVYNLKTSPMQISWGQVTLPSGYSQTTLNNDNITEPAYWIGMGATQLTKDAMMEFFGWYYQNLANGHPVEAANYKAFVKSYLNDGVLGFTGAFWYWMYRINGSGYRTIHQAVTDQNKLVCQDIAAVSRLVNGGCNHYNPGRVDYYQYFLGLFNITLTPVTGTYNVLINYVPTPTQLNSMVCDSNLQAYCQVK